jgi:hypothetical protein
MNEQKTNTYKVSIFNFNDGEFFVDNLSLEWLNGAHGKSRKNRKWWRKGFFRRGYGCDIQEVRIYLNYDLDIKRYRIHARITANYPISSMSRKQLVKYKTQVIHERILAKIMRSKLKFRII